MPVNLTKGEDGKMRIGGIAATEDKDLQGEIVKLDGLDISELKNGRGVFNDDHRKGFENIVGVIDHAKVDDKGLYVEGELLDNEKGRNIYKIMSFCQKNDKAPRVQMSIEGKILKRAGSDRKVVAKAKVDKIALTLDPINKNTYADLVKSLFVEDGVGEQDSQYENKKSECGQEFSPSSPHSALSLDERVSAIESKLHKALEAQSQNYSNTLPGQMSGATALSRESIDGKKKKIKEILKSLATQYPNVDVGEIAKAVFKNLTKKEK
jgi:hypothetical protein